MSKWIVLVMIVFVSVNAFALKASDISVGQYRVGEKFVNKGYGDAKLLWKLADHLGGIGFLDPAYFRDLDELKLELKQTKILKEVFGNNIYFSPISRAEKEQVNNRNLDLIQLKNKIVIVVNDDGYIAYIIVTNAKLDTREKWQNYISLNYLSGKPFMNFKGDFGYAIFNECKIIVDVCNNSKLAAWGYISNNDNTDYKISRNYNHNLDFINLTMKGPCLYLCDESAYNKLIVDVFKRINAMRQREAEQQMAGLQDVKL